MCGDDTVTWLCNPKPSARGPHGFLADFFMRAEGGKWFLQISSPVRTACDLIEKLLKDMGVDVRRSDWPDLNMCTLDFKDPKLFKKAFEILKKKAEKLPPEKAEYLSKRIEEFARWSNMSSFHVSEDPVEGLYADGEVAAPFFHHPDFIRWNRETVELGVCSKTCRVYEVHVHNSAGQSSVHLHMVCTSPERDPRHIAYCVRTITDKIFKAAERMIDETTEKAKK